MKKNGKAKNLEPVVESTTTETTELTTAPETEPVVTPTPEPNPTVAATKFGRIDAAVGIIREATTPISMDEWIEKASQLYAAHGGRDNPKEAGWSIGVTIKVLRAMDLLSENEKGYALFGSYETDE